MNNNTGIIIQARRGASRFPDKIIKPFFRDKSVLELIIEKLLFHYGKYPVIVATTTNPQDDLIEQLATHYSIPVFRGDENHVLSRFIQTAKNYNIPNIIRVCADNPFLDMPHIANLISNLKTMDFDYVSYINHNGLPTIKTHLGLFAEGVKLSALEKANELTDNPVYTEHVTNFIYENPSIFKLKFLNLPGYFSHTENIRLTLDTEEDFKLEKELYEKYHQLDTQSLISIIKKDQNLIKLMQKQIEKNRK